MNEEITVRKYETNNISESFSVFPTFTCDCIDEKIFRITFDGGTSGNYIIEYCAKCYELDDKQFLISQEVIHGPK